MDIGPSAGVAFFLLCFDTWAINLIKRLLSKVHGKHLGLNFDRVMAIPGETWIFCAIAIPVIACLAFRFDLVYSITGTDVTLPAWMARVVSGVMVGMGAQKSYDLTKAVRSLAAKKGIATAQTWRLRGGGEP